MELLQSIYTHALSRKNIAITGVAILFAIVAGYWITSARSLSGNNGASVTTIDLLQSGWNYMPGAAQRTNGLYVSYLGRAIVQQNGTPGQKNPGVNLYGTRLQTLKDFTLLTELADIKGEASFRLYATPPIVQDEFRIEPKSIDFRLNGSTLTINEWNGYNNEKLYQQKPTNTASYAITPRTNNELKLERKKNQLHVIVNGKQLATLNYDAYFKENIWFGISAERPNSNWTLASLTVQAASPNDIRAINTQDITAAASPPDSSLQSLASNKRPGFLIGAAMAFSPSVGDEAYRNLAYGGNFGMMTTENSLKWQSIHPQPNIYDFTEADALVDIAKKNNLQVQGHTLVFAEANPQWVQDLPTETAEDKEKIKQVMIDHITKTITQFKGRVSTWDVVNEPLSDNSSDPGGLRQHKWYDAMGEDYISIAFNAARQADPDAKLYINDYGLEQDGERWDAMLALVTKLKSQGVPVDGIGFESHVYEEGDEIDPVALRTHIRALAAIGVSSRISEMDVFSSNGTAAQAKQYSDVLNVCIQEPSCTSWTTWGVSDKYNLYETDEGTLGYGQDFLWTDQFKPTPAIPQMQAVLKAR